MKKSAFFDFFNRRQNVDFDSFLADSKESDDYIDWNDYVLPQNYGNAEFEYQAIRQSCALFDVSPIRKFRIQGLAAGKFLDYLLTRPVSGASAMTGIYVAFCNADGSLKDDSILYKYANDDYLLMPSDMDHSPHFDVLRQQLGIQAADLSIVDCTDDWLGVAVQGPKSAGVLSTMGFAGVADLKPFEVRDYPLGQGEIRIARMGFTADLGYECWFTRDLQEQFEQAITAARATLGLEIPGYGLTALEACRLEGGFIVAGWDFSTEADPAPGFERSPYEVGLGWLVNLDGAAFVGRKALLEKRDRGHRYYLRNLQISDSRKPEDGAALYAEVDGEECLIGSISCSAWSWGLEAMIGNASIDSVFSDVRKAWTVIDGERLMARLSVGPQLNLERRNKVPADIEL
ncbi:MAG: aminomethyltransferase family protein [Pseudomonadales bacterium]